MGSGDDPFEEDDLQDFIFSIFLPVSTSLVVDKTTSQLKLILRFVQVRPIVLTRTGEKLFATNYWATMQKPPPPPPPPPPLVSDDEYDEDLREPRIKLLEEDIARMLKIWSIFAIYHGFKELASSISKTNDLPCALKLKAPKQQMQINDYFKPN